MKTAKRYMYVAGLATGVIMTMVSMLVVFQAINYLEKGGSWMLAVLAAVVSGLLTGGLLSVVVDRFSRD